MVPKQVELLIHCYITLMEIVGQLKKLYEDASCIWRSTCRFANLGVAAVKPATSATHFQNRSPLHIAGKCWRCRKRRPFNKMSGFQMVNAGGGGCRLKHKWQIALFCTFNIFYELLDQSSVHLLLQGGFSSCPSQTCPNYYPTTTVGGQVFPKTFE